jgi:hypothetical protein
MTEPRAGWRGLVTIALVAVPLFALLGAAGWFAARAWIKVSGPPLPVNGYIAMTLGVIFSLVVGCGLMALLFYSNRHGYDDLNRPEDDEFQPEDDEFR